jgi:hypothetical protein
VLDARLTGDTGRPATTAPTTGPSPRDGRWSAAGALAALLLLLLAVRRGARPAAVAGADRRDRSNRRRTNQEVTS